MNFQDIYTLTFFATSIKGFNFTDNIFLDTILIGIFSIIYIFGNTRKFKEYLHLYIEYFIEGSYYEFKIIAKKEKVPINFKAILWYIFKNKNNSIKYMEQFTDFTWDRNDNNIESDKYYIINQLSKFKITNDIYGKMHKEIIETARRADFVEYKDNYILKLHSKTKTLDDIILWVEEIVKDYKKYMKLKTIENQLLLSVSYQEKLIIKSCEFESTATFKNSYLPNYGQIINKIDFFLDNKDWYDKKGIPYNLGIILYGEPGCGKTRFIKQIMNYTGRHGIDIKLNNKFCFDTLKNIIHNENINDEFIIPQQKRIIIFEDIDAMCDILKDRDLIENENKEKNKSLNNFINQNNNLKELDKISTNSTNETLNNNNLSYFLNIIDGLNECSGRIIIMTTNKIDYLDKAIIRPGRIDIKINFEKYDLHNICGIINKFWDKNYKKNQLREDINNKYTSAEIINIFRTTESFDNIKNLFIK